MKNARRLSSLHRITVSSVALAALVPALAGRGQVLEDIPSGSQADATAPVEPRTDPVATSVSEDLLDRPLSPHPYKPWAKEPPQEISGWGW